MIRYITSFKTSVILPKKQEKNDLKNDVHVHKYTTVVLAYAYRKHIILLIIL